MSELNLPPCDFKLKEDEGKQYIFDPLRRKYIVLTPEEWVRQHFVSFLIGHKNYPAGRIGNEISLLLNNRKRRCDTVVYNSCGQPQVIVEYKAPHIPITQLVFDQIVRYNMVLQVKYLIVSNGMAHYCCEIDYKSGDFRFLEDIPLYEHLQL